MQFSSLSWSSTPQMNNTDLHLFARFVSLLHAKLSRSQFLILACVVVGFVAGLAGVGLKAMVHYLQALINPTFTIANHQYSLFVAPLVGILLTVLVVNTLFQGKIGKGIANILYEIAQKSSFVHRDKMYSHIITSAITVGFGGSVGLEAPILVTGSALGSNLGKHLALNYKDRTLLLAAGAAAGIAAIFNAPITGVIFAIEVLLVEVSIAEIIPLIIAAVCGALTNKVILNEAILFTFTLKQDFNYHNVPFYLGLGLLCGAVSLYYARATHIIEHFFAQRQKNAFLQPYLVELFWQQCVFCFHPCLAKVMKASKSLPPATSNISCITVCSPNSLIHSGFCWCSSARLFSLRSLPRLSLSPAAAMVETLLRRYLSVRLPGSPFPGPLSMLMPSWSDNGTSERSNSWLNAASNCATKAHS